MSVANAFVRQRRAWIAAEMVGLLLVIRVLDLITSYKFRLLPFYAVPIFGMAWFYGRTAGMVVGFTSGVIWWCVNWFGGDPELRSWIGVWETGRHFGFFLVVALTASALRTRSDIAAARIKLLEHSQRLEHEIVNISEAEQRRIGQDLHDGLCQYLAALSCSARSLEDDLQKLNLQYEAKAAGELATLLQEAIVQTRDLARGLVPAQVAQLGIIVALESLAQSVSRLHGIKCTFRFQGAVPNCNEETAMHLYRIAQEAINNAMKHGKASKVAISLNVADDYLTLRILDDGIGMPAFVSTGSGLGIMRYRARLSGGELQIEQPKGGGTMVTCTISQSRQRNEIAAA
jgi:signal transduction histidine kinase